MSDSMSGIPMFDFTDEVAPVCDDCDGTGKVEVAAYQTRGRSCSNEAASFMAGEIVGEVECETCGGLGFIIESEDARPSLNLERMIV